MLLHTTHATQEEILNANNNLARLGESLRYFAEGTFTSPTLHGAGG